MKTLVTKQMALIAALLFLIAVVAYMYTVSSQVKVSGCNTCPSKQSSALD